ncbi:MAG: SRPBCC domain-containing protein [Actinobacteria bacterium]|nr:SRPBCC domain-containing protein [Actinomycetota bacterium]
MPEDSRSIELEVEVEGTPEEVWRAIATGPGISSWYVPHSVEEHEGGAAIASFGAGPEMQMPGRVAAWDPPHRVVFDGGEGVEGLAFEWLIEAKDGGTCIVRLINSGFASGTDWDDQYDAMTDGWGMFMFNLQQHLLHFGGESATPMLPMAQWVGPRENALTRLFETIGLPASPSVGDSVTTSGVNVPEFAGTIERVEPWHIVLKLESPCAGTALLAAEGKGEEVSASVWAYFYGPDQAEIAERQQARWQKLLDADPRQR